MKSMSTANQYFIADNAVLTYCVLGIPLFCPCYNWGGTNFPEVVCLLFEPIKKKLKRHYLTRVVDNYHFESILTKWTRSLMLENCWTSTMLIAYVLKTNFYFITRSSIFPISVNRCTLGLDDNNRQNKNCIHTVAIRLISRWRWWLSKFLPILMTSLWYKNANHVEFAFNITTPFLERFCERVINLND